MARLIHFYEEFAPQKIVPLFSRGPITLLLKTRHQIVPQIVFFQIYYIYFKSLERDNTMTKKIKNNRADLLAKAKDCIK